jgi:hypothetical protein
MTETVFLGSLANVGLKGALHDGKEASKRTILRCKFSMEEMETEMRRDEKR